MIFLSFLHNFDDYFNAGGSIKTKGEADFLLWHIRKQVSSAPILKIAGNELRLTFTTSEFFFRDRIDAENCQEMCECNKRHRHNNINGLLSAAADGPAVNGYIKHVLRHHKGRQQAAKAQHKEVRSRIYLK